MTKTLIATLIVFFTIGFTALDDWKINFPQKREKVKEQVQKENLWVFILAGQSNMAGRGFVEPSDTLSNSRIITLGQNKDWEYAKEPLHFYEPKLTGLDCGLSFARELSPHIPDSVTIALIPCAVGGSSITKWIEDQEHRGVNLLSNFKERAAIAQKAGVIKGILWHQGESDAKDSEIPLYGERLDRLFSQFRKIVQEDNTPILVGELGSYKPEATQKRWDAINSIIREKTEKDPYSFLIKTGSLKHKGDGTHFDTASQRELGRKFAEKYCREVLELD